MRNWNTIHRKEILIFSLRFYFTYEELKLHRAIGNSIFRSGFYFTYEELKHVTCAFLQSKLFEFLLYLWGIETLTPSEQKYFKKPGFYFTYEELKHLDLGQTDKRLGCFYFTYEELKLRVELLNHPG